MLTIVVCQLKRHPLAMVQFSDVKKMEIFACLTHQHEPEVDNLIGFMDSLALTSECTLEPIEQNAMYSGYQK
jgi:hypothetical protein